MILIALMGTNGCKTDNDSDSTCHTNGNTQCCLLIMTIIVLIEKTRMMIILEVTIILIIIIPIRILNK